MNPRFRGFVVREKEIDSPMKMMMKELLLISLLCLVAHTRASPPMFRDVFVDVPQDTQHYVRLLIDAEKTVNMRRNETNYPHRKLIATHYARHKSVIDTGVAEAGITVAQTNCTVRDRFEYRQNFDNYQNCALIEVSLSL
jgi:hypothetical protein